MKNLGIVAFYVLIALTSVVLFITIRWYVISENPVLYDTKQEKILTPDEAEALGYEISFDHNYVKVSKSKVFISAGSFPEITKKVKKTSNIEVRDVKDREKNPKE